MSKILIVVHRIANGGGSERNCLLYATALSQMGYDVTILTNEIVGHFDATIRITTDINVINEKYSLCVVHGDCNIQNYFLSQKLIEPMLYLIIRPDDKLPIIFAGMKNATKIGCVTSKDIELVKKYGYLDKMITVRYPVECPIIKLSKDEIREKFNITKEKVYISIGGYWFHKQFGETSQAFIEANLQNTELIFTGYDTRFETTDYVKMGEQAGVKIQQFLLENQQDVYELLSIADLQICNSIPSHEGFALSIVEGLIYGVPFICRYGVPAGDMYSHLAGRQYSTHDELIDFMKHPLIYDSRHMQMVKGYIQELHDKDSAAGSLLQFNGLK